MRREQSRRFPIPAKLMACFCVFAFFSGTTWLAGLTGFLPEWMPASVTLMVGLGFACVLFPTGRRLGGCGLGCGLGFLAMIAMSLVASRFPAPDHIREPVRESAPVPQWLNRVVPLVDGVTLGMPCARVPSGVLVECSGEVVTAVEGRELRQGDRVLVSAGDLLNRAQRVLQPGVEPRVIFRREGFLFVLQAEGSRVKSIRMTRESI